MSVANTPTIYKKDKALSLPFLDIRVFCWVVEKNAPAMKNDRSVTVFCTFKITDRNLYLSIII
jgi:hypothetical protein